MAGTTGHIWAPPADVRVAGEAARGRVRYGAPWAVAAGVQVPLSPATEALRVALVRGLRGVPEVGGVRPAARRAAPAQYDPHRNGFALDVMIANDAARAARGDAIANWLVLNMERLGLQYVLWSGYECSLSRSGAVWEPYAGSDPHRDHVHVEVGPDARAWPAETMRARVAEAMAAGGVGAMLAPWLLAGALVALAALVWGA